MQKKGWQLRIGDFVNVQKRREIEHSVMVSKGEQMYLGFDKKLHHGKHTAELQKNMKIIDGVSATGLSDYVYNKLFEILPMEEIIETFDLDEMDIKEGLDDAFVNLGAIAS